jgi:hypothetical protein
MMTTSGAAERGGALTHRSPPDARPGTGIDGCPVVRHGHVERRTRSADARLDRDARTGGQAVAVGVHERFRPERVCRGGDIGRHVELIGDVEHDVHAARPLTVHEPAERGSEPELVEHRRQQRSTQLTDVRHALVRLLAQAVEEALGCDWIARAEVAVRLQPETDAGQRRAETVVEVAPQHTPLPRRGPP